jgi:hypothetical protein
MLLLRGSRCRWKLPSRRAVENNNSTLQTKPDRKDPFINKPHNKALLSSWFNVITTASNRPQNKYNIVSGQTATIRQLDFDLGLFSHQNRPNVLLSRTIRCRGRDAFELKKIVELAYC